MKKFWNWKNQETDSEDERVLEFYGTIADVSWFNDDITPQIFKEELYSGRGPVTVWINSPGGDCIAASQIYSMLRDYPGQITVKIDGLAASAASVIAMGGTKVLMAPTALMMIHNPATGAFGDHNEMTKTIEMLDEVKESIINAYVLKSGQSRAKLSHLMEAETWMNATKAIELGLCDGLIEDEKKTDQAFSAFAFSRNTSERAFLNMIIEKVEEERPKEEIDPDELKVQDLGDEDEVPFKEKPIETEDKNSGRSVDALMERLFLLSR